MAFARQWDKNLAEQGFVEAARATAGWICRVAPGRRRKAQPRCAGRCGL